MHLFRNHLLLWPLLPPLLLLPCYISILVPVTIPVSELLQVTAVHEASSGSILLTLIFPVSLPLSVKSVLSSVIDVTFILLSDVNAFILKLPYPLVFHVLLSAASVQLSLFFTKLVLLLTDAEAFIRSLRSDDSACA